LLSFMLHRRRALRASVRVTGDRPERGEREGEGGVETGGEVRICFSHEA
jgi:hypothetical protein